MEFLNVLILVLVAVFIVYQGYNSFKTFKQTRESLQFIKQNKKNIVICKDYVAFAVLYAILAVFMFMYGAIYLNAKIYLLGGLFVLFSAFCFVYVIDSIATRTVAFFDGGFLCYGKMYKYKAVQKVEEKSRILRGSEIRIIGEVYPIYLSKKSKAILEERLQDYKNKSKKRK